MFYPGPWLAGGTEKHALALALVASEDRQVEILTFSTVSQTELGRALHLNLESLRFRTLPEVASDALAAYTASYDLWVNTSSWHPIPSHNPRSVYLVVYPPLFRSSMLRRLRRAVGVKMRAALCTGTAGRMASRFSPRLVRRLRLASAVAPEDALASYQVFAANSEFTRAVIQRRWGRESYVLYPPVDIEAFRPLPKRPMILSVGRFGRGGNNKKHDALIEAFRSLVDGGLLGWELHLAGSTHDDPWNRAYLDRITRMAEGYPIVFHLNVAHAELRRLYGESTIYWHGAGYGEDEDRNPLRVEHFGITTVEAMAAGCIPIVCGKGGQPEIVAHGVQGLLWTTLKQLKQYTREVIDHPIWMAHLRDQAIDRSRKFGMEEFTTRAREVLRTVGHSGPAFSRRY